jgi:hypothetical protein
MAKKIEIIIFAHHGGFGGSLHLTRALNLYSSVYKVHLINAIPAPYGLDNHTAIASQTMVSDHARVDKLISRINHFFICDYQGLIPICKYLSKKHNRVISHRIKKQTGLSTLLGFLKTKKVVFFWSGTKYLNNHNVINKWIKDIGCKKRFAMLDLLRCDPGALPLYQPFGLSPAPKKFTKFTLCHSPGKKYQYKNGPGGKGTAFIESAFSHMKSKYDIDYYILKDCPYEEALSIKGQSHIFVDQIMPNIGGMGKSALESFMLGTPVMSDVRFCKFVAPYNDCPVINIESENTLINHLDYLYNNQDKLSKIRLEGLKWGRALSFKNTSIYLDKNISW